MRIPKKFKIANQEFNVIVKDKDIDDDEDLGLFTYCPPAITIAKSALGEPLSEEQLLNTFYHELIHCFQYMYGNELSETEAQTFANFIREFQASV